MALGLDGLALLVIVFRVGGCHLPAEQGAGQHRRRLRFGHAAALVTLIYNGQGLRPVVSILICAVIAALALFDNNDLILLGSTA